MTSFVVQMKDPRWSDAPGGTDWQAEIARILPSIWNSHAGPGEGTAPETAFGEVCLVFTNDTEVSALNKTWRGKDGPTNVLSFPAEEDEVEAVAHVEDPGKPALSEDSVLGDVVLAFETIAREAGEQNKSFHNHTVHLLVHGVLHLLEYDHQNDEEAGQMECLERKILATLDIADPYKADSQV